MFGTEGVTLGVLQPCFRVLKSGTCSLVVALFPMDAQRSFER